MAITKTTSVERVEVYPQANADAADTLNAGNPTLMVVYIDMMDDPDDDDLPQPLTRVKHLQRYSDEDNATATVLTNEAQIVQDICGTLWS